LYCSSLGIVIGFLETNYTVSEGDGTARLRVGVIGQGDLETDIVVNVSTTDGTAICKFRIIILIIKYHNNYECLSLFHHQLRILLITLVY
jgi:hypothetical protein